MTKKLMNAFIKDFRWVLKNIKIEVGILEKGLNKLDKGIVDKTKKLGKR